MKKLTFFVLMYLPVIANSQYSWFYDMDGNVINGSYYDFGPGKTILLHDFRTKRDFIVDCTHTLISSYDSNGKLLWATDPWRDNSIPEYRTKRPFIIYIRFRYINPNDWTFNRFQMWNAKSLNDYFPTQIRTNVMVLSIVYNNTQFGWISLETGKFLWGGQD